MGTMEDAEELGRQTSAAVRRQSQEILRLTRDSPTAASDDDKDVWEDEKLKKEGPASPGPVSPGAVACPPPMRRSLSLLESDSEEATELAASMPPPLINNTMSQSTPNQSRESVPGAHRVSGVNGGETDTTSVMERGELAPEPPTESLKRTVTATAVSQDDLEAEVRRQIMSQTVTAEVIEDDEVLDSSKGVEINETEQKLRKYRRRIRLLCLLLVMAAMIAVVATVTAVVVSNHMEDDKPPRRHPNRNPGDEESLFAGGNGGNNGGGGKGKGGKGGNGNDDGNYGSEGPTDGDSTEVPGIP